MAVQKTAINQAALGSLVLLSEGSNNNVSWDWNHAKSLSSKVLVLNYIGQCQKKQSLDFKVCLSQ